LNTFKVFNTIAFIVFCLAIGHTISTLLTCFVLDVGVFQILEALKDPKNADRSLVLLPSLFYTVFSFLIIPSGYLLLRRKSSLRYLWTTPEITVRPFLFSITMIFSLIPVVSILIELNQGLSFPGWLSGLEEYFKEGEGRAKQWTNSLLSVEKIDDLVIVILIVAIIPGLAEEFFFRGLVQHQLQDVLKNKHQAILLAAFLFSFFHFQLYGFIPRMLLGILFGYLFIWSNNILYPIAAHVTNNLIGVLVSYFWGTDSMNHKEGGLLPLVLLFPSIIITAAFILYFKRSVHAKQLEYHP
jgi:membrane protease YdiL (CAAX protease family)